VQILATEADALTATWPQSWREGKMKMRVSPLLGLALLALPDPSVLASPRLGVVAIHADGSACVTLRGEPLKAGTPFLAILFAPPRIVDGVVGQKASAPCNRASTSEDRSSAAQLRHRMGDTDEVGVAICAPGARAEYAAGEFLVYTRDAKGPLSFRRCASQEGLHLTAWRGARRTWHAYWYLGFDVESDCTDEEAAEGGPR